MRTRAWPHPGFARIVFDWPAAVSFEAKIENGDLTIDFGRALETDFARMQDLLKDYIEAVALENDGQRVRIGLRGEYRLRTSTSNTSVVIDLLDAAAAPTPNANQDENAGDDTEVVEVATEEPAADEVTAVRVRVGVHDAFTRIVFDWTRNVEYQVERTGDSVSIQFGARATFNLGRLGRGERPLINAAIARTLADGAVIALDIESSARLRHFRDGTKVVVDILRAPSQVAEAQPSAEPATAVPAPEPPPVSEPEEEEQEDTEPEPELPPAEESETPVLDVETVAAVPPAGPTAPTELVARDEDSDGPSAAASGGVTIVVSEGTEGPAITFEWPRPTAAAFFNRAGFLWAVFPETAPADILPIPEEVQNTVFLVEQAQVTGATAIRFKIREDLRATASLEESTWRLEFARRLSVPANPIRSQRIRNSVAGPSFLMPADEPILRVELHDPEVGDIIYVMPLLTPGRGLTTTRIFAEFTVLASAQGIAVIARSDSIEVRAQRNGVEIASPNGLAISDVAEPEFADDGPPPRQRVAPADLLPSLFQYAAWRGNDYPTFALLGKRAGFSPRVTKPIKGGSKRLGIVEILQIDAKRRLLLIRRDDIEHLILLGSDGDSVVESGMPAKPEADNGGPGGDNVRRFLGRIAPRRANGNSE